jgi:transposase
LDLGARVAPSENIEEVSIDLWKGYKNLVRKLMPNAQLVSDRFYVMPQINKELYIQIKPEKRKIKYCIETTKISEHDQLSEE